MCVQKFVNFALKRPHSNLQWFGTVVSLAMRERRYWTNSMLLLWVLLRSLLRTSAFRYTIRFDLLDESICFPQTFGPFDLSTTCCSHSVRKVWFANSVCVYALYADLWRRSTTRGHSGVTLRSSTTTRWRRRRRRVHNGGAFRWGALKRAFALRFHFSLCAFHFALLSGPIHTFWENFKWP